MSTSRRFKLFQGKRRLSYQDKYRLKKKVRISTDDKEEDTQNLEFPSDDTSSVKDTEEIADDIRCEESSISGDEDHFNLSDYDSNTESTEEEHPMILYRKPICNSVEINMSESVHLVRQLSSKHNLTKAATVDILKLLSAHLPDCVRYPKTHKQYNRLLGFSEELSQKIFYCNECQVALVTNECRFCQKVYDFKKLTQVGHYFLLFDLRSQIIKYLNDPRFNTSLVRTFQQRLRCDDVLSDITSGRLYRECSFSYSDITCTFNSDGVKVFGSSQYSIWPVLFCINELRFTIRKNSTMLAGLWFGDKKPNFSMLLSSMVTSMNDLSINPISWKSAGGLVFTSNVFFILCCADSPARCCLQGHSQFNGRYGCNWCINPGEVIEKGRGHCRIYQPTDHEKRLSSSYTKAAYEQNFTQGIKRASPLLMLKNFNIIDGFSVDIMHAIYLGIVRTFTNLWIESYGSDFYIGTQVTSINKRLRGVRVPTELGRTMRDITSRKFWKASEWRTWLLISPVILKGLLKKKFLKHWSLLCTSIFLLCGTNITKSNLKVCDGKLLKFRNRTLELYGRGHCSFNLHQLSHLVECVENWGPAWGTSAFQFESFNGKLTSYIKSSNGVPQQISRKFSEYAQEACITDNIFKMGSKAYSLFTIEFSRAIMKTEYAVVNAKQEHIKKSTKRKLADYCHTISNIKRGNTAIIEYHIYKTNTTSKRCNNIIQLPGGGLGIIRHFFKATCRCLSSSKCEEEFVLVDFVKPEVFEKSEYIVSFTTGDSDTGIFPISSLKASKFITYEDANKIYAARLPNLVETT